MTWSRVRVESIRADSRHSLVGGPFGSDLTRRDYVDEGIPVIRGVNLPAERVFNDDDFVFVREEKADQLLSNNAYRGDVIFTQRGTLGQVGLIPEDSRFSRYLVSQSQMKLTVDPSKADSRFVFYFFRHPITIQAIKSRALTSGVPHINLGILREFELPLPPLDAQREIVKALSAYDDLIENNRRRMALLEESARLLYREWFVCLRFPGHEHTRIVDGIPERWSGRPLRELAEVVMGQSPASQYYNETGEGLPFHQGVADFGDRFVMNRIYTTAEGRVALASDILCSVRAPVGRLNITLDRIVIGRGLAALRSLSGNQSFLFYQLKTHFFKEDLIGAGAIFASVTRAEFESQKLLTPPPSLVRTFEEIAGPLGDQLRVLFLQNQKLKVARDLLLPRLMSGEIVV